MCEGWSDMEKWWHWLPIISHTRLPRPPPTAATKQTHRKGRQIHKSTNTASNKPGAHTSTHRHTNTSTTLRMCYIPLASKNRGRTNREEGKRSGKGSVGGETDEQFTACPPPSSFSFLSAVNHSLQHSRSAACSFELCLMNDLSQKSFFVHNMFSTKC